MEKMSHNEIGEKKTSLVLFLFIFTMMFSFVIAGHNMRYIVIVVWTLYSLMYTKKIYINSKLMMFPTVLFFIIVYSFISIIIHGTYNSFEILRCTRAIITYMLIILFLSSGRYSIKQLINALSYVLLLHAICIILGVVFPPLKEIVLPISQYSKEFLKVRSSGFLSGYDDAGYLCNVGFILTLVGNSLYKKKLVNARALIFLLAVIFTSRFNLACMAFILIIIFLFNVKNMNIKGIFNIGKYVFIIGIFVVIVWSLTTNVGMGMRIQLVSKYPILDSFYSLMSTSYTDYGVYTSVISQHASINLNLYNMIFGVGVRMTKSDIGFVKTIYSIGIIGIVVQVLTYFKSILYMYRIKKFYAKKYSIQIFALTFIAAVILMIAMETKNSFIFSSTTFEMLSIIYITCELSAKKVIL